MSREVAAEEIGGRIGPGWPRAKFNAFFGS